MDNSVHGKAAIMFSLQTGKQPVVGVLVLAIILSLTGFVSQVNAEVFGPLISIKAEAANGDSCILDIPLEGNLPGFNEQMQYRLSNALKNFEFRGQGNAMLGKLNDLSVTFIGDPAVILDFSVSAGNVDTTFTLTSAMLPVGLTNPEGYATATLTVTDNNSNGATVTGLFGGKAYQARYNTSTVFASLVDTVVAPAYSSNVGIERSPAAGMTTISGTVNDMLAEYKFTLTANDSASGTSRFEIIPEPSAMILLGLGAAAILRRR